MKNKVQKIIAIMVLGTLLANCSSKDPAKTTPTPPTNPNPTGAMIDYWLTKADGSVKLQQQSNLQFDTSYNNYTTIDVDASKTYQTIEGFGFALTGGSAQVINSLDVTKRDELLQELFGSGPNSIGISYLRVSIGGSDLDATNFSYDDMPAGQTDPTLTNFSIAPDKVNLIPILKAILAINPNIKIMGSPWSAPVWMKDNGKIVGGSLIPKYFSTYSKYFIKYIQAMKAEGITIDAVTLQNEPLWGGNDPSMIMQAVDQANFIKNNIGPDFKAAGITTKVIVWDHNLDNLDYAKSILNDAAASPYVAGSGFHLYGGDISGMSNVHEAAPTKDVYFTEYWTGSKELFKDNLRDRVKKVIIGSMRNWSKATIQWNLANDAQIGPHTPGGCGECLGAITVTGSNSFERNVGYYIDAHASKFVPAGSVRIDSTVKNKLQDVAFKTPAGKIVLIVVNDEDTTQIFNIKINGSWATTTLEPGSVGTYIW